MIVARKWGAPSKRCEATIAKGKGVVDSAIATLAHSSNL
jgi:hypothetical protein